MKLPFAMHAWASGVKYGSFLVLKKGGGSPRAGSRAGSEAAHVSGGRICSAGVQGVLGFHRKINNTWTMLEAGKGRVKASLRLVRGGSIQRKGPFRVVLKGFAGILCR
jgi:hypothetical protein